MVSVGPMMMPEGEPATGELETLRAEIARLRGMLDDNILEYPPVNKVDNCMVCGGCAYRDQHEDDCAWKIAQKYLGTTRGEK